MEAIDYNYMWVLKDIQNLELDPQMENKIIDIINKYQEIIKIELDCKEDECEIEYDEGYRAGYQIGVDDSSCDCC